MATVSGKCSACGAPVEIDAAGAFSDADLAAPLCPACIDAQFLAGGGAVLTLHRELEGGRFPLGKVTVTPGAVAALAESAQHVVTFLVRHVHGDWGEYGHCDQIEMTEDERRRGWEATDDPGKVNTSNLLNGRDRVMSEYTTTRGHRLWVVTDLGRGGGTTVLLPEEY